MAFFDFFFFFYTTRRQGDVFFSAVDDCSIHAWRPDAHDLIRSVPERVKKKTFKIRNRMMKFPL